MARLTRYAEAISDDEISDVEVTRETGNRSGRAKSAAKYKGPEPLELDEDDEMLYTKSATNGKAADDEDDEEEGEDGDEPEE
jgi:hypothetical protein